MSDLFKEEYRKIIKDITILLKNEKIPYKTSKYFDCIVTNINDNNLYFEFNYFGRPHIYLNHKHLNLLEEKFTAKEIFLQIKNANLTQTTIK